MLVPGVALGHQQHRVFQDHLPAYQSRFLSGEDQVDTWSDQPTWDAILKNIRIVISTHQVLLDALTHGFIKLSQIALLIFDEGQLHLFNRMFMV
jgi:ERCC4-related helicase